MYRLLLFPVPAVWRRKKNSGSGVSRGCTDAISASTSSEVSAHVQDASDVSTRTSSAIVTVSARPSNVGGYIKTRENVGLKRRTHLKKGT